MSCRRGDVLPVPAAVAGAPHLAVVGPRPQALRLLPRGRQRVDHAAARAGAEVVRGRHRVEVRRHARRLAGQVGADDLPAQPAVGGAEHPLPGEVQHPGVDRREGQRQGPHAAPHVGAGDGGIDRARLLGAQVEPVDGAAVDHLRVERVDDDVVGLAAGGDLLELLHGDAVAGGGAAGQGDRARVLLRPVDPVGEAVVGRHVVELRRRLVVPGAPARPAVDADDRPLVDAEDAALGVLGVDPQLVEVVAGGVAFDGHEGAAAVGRAQQHGVAGVDDVGVLRLHGDAAEVPAAVPDAGVGAGPRPVAAAVVGAVEAALVGVDQGVDAGGLARRHREADPPRRGGEAVALDAAPVLAAVGRLVEPRSGAVRRRVDVPRRPPRLPQGGVDHVRVPGLEDDVDRAGVGVRPQDLPPVRPAVGRLEEPALGVRAVGVAERRHEDHVGVARIDLDAPDLLRVPEADEAPGGAAVDRLEDPLALGDVRAHVGLAGADVEHPRVRRRHRQRPDRAHRLLVEDRPPGAPGVDRLPDAAVDRPEVEVVRLARHPRHREHPAAAERPDEPPVEILEQRRVDGGGGEAAAAAGGGTGHRGERDGGEERREGEAAQWHREAFLRESTEIVRPRTRRF